MVDRRLSTNDIPRRSVRESNRRKNEDILFQRGFSCLNYMTNDEQAAGLITQTCTATFMSPFAALRYEYRLTKSDGRFRERPSLEINALHTRHITARLGIDADRIADLHKLRALHFQAGFSFHFLCDAGGGIAANGCFSLHHFQIHR